MERNCKNCGDLIYAGKHHCANCGSKWIDNRITMKQVAHDFSDMYIGLDTKFLRTFIDLFKKPDAVILGYINGRRVNYMDAVRYLLLALFFTGIYTFALTKTGVLDGMMESQKEATLLSYQSMGMDEAQALESADNAIKFTKVVFEFQGFVLLFTIPFLALVARITFWGKRYFNFTEQIVFYLYTYGHSVIVTTPISMFLIFVAPDAFTYLGFVSLPLLYLYNAYCYKSCFKLSLQETVLKTLISVLVFFAIIVMLSIVVFVFAILVGLLLKATGVI